MTVKLLTEHHLEFLSLNGGCTGLSESTLVKLFEISCRGSICFSDTYCDSLNKVNQLIVVLFSFALFIIGPV